MKVYVLIGSLVLVGFSAEVAPVPDSRTCHFCLLEDPAIGCISGSEKCTINSLSPCMVISIFHELKPRFIIRACGQYSSYRCQEQHNTYFMTYWYRVQCCQYDYCNSWSSPQLQSPPSEHPGKSLALPLSELQTQWFYAALNLSLPIPSFHAGLEPGGLDLPADLPLSLGLSITDLRHIYLFLNRSGLLFLPRADP
ncbi:lymphocyte antigen 6 complex locus protein G5b [Rhynchocyon petersi]